MDTMNDDNQKAEIYQYSNNCYKKNYSYFIIVHTYIHTII